ncbi:MAG: VCBS repeat-containing protein [Spirochaetaceae bacterium]|nr:VCBS repeat-containing protein [Spirochaetaceae bacterium]
MAGKTPPGSPKGGILLRLLKMIFAVLLICALITLGAELVFLLTRLSPDSVIPDRFSAYVHISSPLELGSKVLDHESLPELMVNPALASLTPALSRLRTSGMLKNPWIRLALRGSLSAALTGASEPLLAAWDSAFLAPVLPLLPLAARFIEIPNLSYLPEGVPHFEYRSGETVFYLGIRRNLLMVSNSEDLLFKALSPEGASYASRKPVTMKKQDVSLLAASKTVISMLGEGNPLLTGVFAQLQFPDILELGLNIEPKQLDIHLVSPVDTDNPAFDKLLSKNSIPPSIMNILPNTTQYCTGLAGISLKDILETAAEVQGPEFRNTLSTAGRAAKTLLGLTLDDLLYSWTGEELAVFGLEDRPAPVFAVKIGDESKQRAVFDRAFRSILLSENSRMVLDGNRIPQIALPPFVYALLRIIQVHIPEPYYLIHEDWLLVSESPENILAAVTAARQNQLLAASPDWRKLSRTGENSTVPSGADPSPGSASLSLYYSLNRSLPFFLRGGSAAASILRMYHQGLFRVSVKDRILTLTLSVEPGSNKGLEPVTGYPIDLGRRAGNQVYAVMNGGKNETRLLLSRENTALALNPADHKLYELAGEDPVWVIPAEGLRPRTMKDSAAWVVSSRGLVTLVNGNMEAAAGFPVMTGLRIVSPPAARDGRVYLSAEESGGMGTLYTVDSFSRVVKLGVEFESLLASPSFLPAAGQDRPKTGDTLMALYPRGILGEIYLCDAGGSPRPGWPVQVPGIAYGSPLLFRSAGPVYAAFITMAGELFVYGEDGSTLPAFPLELGKVSYLQPLWDGTYLWTVSEEGYLYRIGLDGRVSEQRVPDLAVKEEGCIVSADVDGDGTPEVFITGEGNALYGYSQNMVSIEGFPLPVWGRPVFEDLDGDGNMDCAGAGMDNKLYRWRFKK